MNGRAIALTAVLAWAGAGSRAAADGSLQAEIARARDKVYPALVNIQLVMEDFNDGRAIRHRGGGSGVIVSPEGFAVTNHHVAGNARRMICTLASGEQIGADLVGTDPATDIAVIRLRVEERRVSAPPLPYARLGDSNGVSVGDYVLAMGNPMMRSNSVSLGIVSNNRRVHMMGVMDGEVVGSMLLWIQHDALIMGGNSGGPLVDLSGTVVGINESGFGDPRGGGMFGMAVPANAAREVLEEILKTARIEKGQVREKGCVRRAWLGLSVQTLLPQMRQEGIERGILVSSVLERSPAGAAGIAPGDRILGLGGEPVRGKDPEDIPLFLRRTARLPIGKPIEVQIARGAETFAVSVTPAEWEKREGDEAEFARWGFTAREVTRPLARDLKLDEAAGVLVTGVRPGGPFGTAKPPIQGGVLRGVAGRQVADLVGLREALTAIEAESPEIFPVEVELHGARLVSVVEGREKPDLTRGREIPRAWLGLDAQVVTAELARALGLAGPGGVRVTQVFPETPAAAAGFRVGDVLTHLDGEAIPTSRPGEMDVFVQMIRRKAIGAEVTLAGLRDGAPLSAKATLAPSPTQPADAPTYKDRDFEFVARDIVFADRVLRRWDRSVAGCVVESVEPSGWAGWSGLMAGDLVQSVDGTPVPNVKAFEEAMRRLRQKRPAHIVFQVLRGASSQFVDVEPEWK